MCERRVIQTLGDPLALPGSHRASTLDGSPGSPSIVAFGIVGALGFVVDAGILALAVQVLGMGVIAGRSLSFATAVTVTWLLNRRWTFRRNRAGGKGAEYIRYTAVQSLGALINFGVFALCVTSSTWLHDHPVLALAVGSGVAMFFNFFGAKHFAFLHHAD